MSREIELLTEIRDLLQVLAEPALAKRDKKLRSSLRLIVGNSAGKAKAAHLMDGTRTQAVIVKETGVDKGALSRMVKSLATANLVSDDEKHPNLLVKIPLTFFDGENADE